MVEELPAASWYAEHIMQKPLHELCEIITVALGDGEVAQFERAWDPKMHDADALQLWRQLPNPKHLYVDKDGGVVVYAPKWAGAGSDEREAICRAVYVWWLAHKKEN